MTSHCAAPRRAVLRPRGGGPCPTSPPVIPSSTGRSDLPAHADPGATSAFFPTTAPGNRVVRALTVASLPTLIGPTWKSSPSIQCPVRSTSGSMELRWPSRSIRSPAGPNADPRPCRPCYPAPARSTPAMGPRPGSPHRWRRPAARQPHPQMLRAPAAIGAGFQVREQHPRASTAMPIRPTGGDEHDERHRHQPPVQRRQPRQRVEVRSHVVGHRQPGQPLQAGEGGQGSTAAPGRPGARAGLV